MRQSAMPENEELHIDINATHISQNNIQSEATNIDIEQMVIPAIRVENTMNKIVEYLNNNSRIVIAITSIVILIGLIFQLSSLGGTTNINNYQL